MFRDGGFEAGDQDVYLVPYEDYAGTPAKSARSTCASTRTRLHLHRLPGRLARPGPPRRRQPGHRQGGVPRAGRRRLLPGADLPRLPGVRRPVHTRDPRGHLLGHRPRGHRRQPPAGQRHARHGSGSGRPGGRRRGGLLELCLRPRRGQGRPRGSGRLGRRPGALHLPGPDERADPRGRHQPDPHQPRHRGRQLRGAADRAALRAFRREVDRRTQPGLRGRRVPAPLRAGRPDAQPRSAAQRDQLRQRGVHGRHGVGGDRGATIEETTAQVPAAVDLALADAPVAPLFWPRGGLVHSESVSGVVPEFLGGARLALLEVS